jgi:hypothetical protein
VGIHQLDKWRRESAPPEYATQAFKILHSPGKITRQQYLELFLDMESKYPGRGWRRQMDELEQFYFDNHLPLSGTYIPLKDD